MKFKKSISRKNKAKIFAWIDCLFFKNNSKVLLVVKNRTEFSGNLRVATDIFLEEKKYKIVVYKDGLFVPEIKKTLKEQGITVLEGWSVQSLFHLLTSGIFIFSHAPRDAHITKKCTNRIIINLWHGVAFKTIENLMPKIPQEKQKQIENNSHLYDMIIASSQEDKRTNTKAFMVNENKVQITGLPRYEILKETYILDNFLQIQQKKILSYKQDKKLILYAPTFRENNISPLEQISNNEWDILSSMLEKNNAIMGIRPHAYDINLPPYLSANKNFIILPQLPFTETNLLLQHVDLLIVDFSSIWIDYLLLHRPIVGFAKDYSHYIDNERGFIYPFEKIFPDTFYTSIADLTKHIDNLLSSKIFDKEYKEAISFFHTYPLNSDFKNMLTSTLHSQIKRF